MTHTHSYMDRTIFLVNASTLATSLYILVCSLLDDNLQPTLARIRGSWNGTEQDLTTAADELVKRGILAPVDFLQEENRWWVVPSTRWFPVAEGGASSTPLKTVSREML
jgi:hypothetical protein